MIPPTPSARANMPTIIATLVTAFVSDVVADLVPLHAAVRAVSASSPIERHWTIFGDSLSLYAASPSSLVPSFTIAITSGSIVLISLHTDLNSSILASVPEYVMRSSFSIMVAAAAVASLIYCVSTLLSSSSTPARTVLPMVSTCISTSLTLRRLLISVSIMRFTLPCTLFSPMTDTREHAMVMIMTAPNEMISLVATFRFFIL